MRWSVPLTTHIHRLCFRNGSGKRDAVRRCHPVHFLRHGAKTAISPCRLATPVGLVGSFKDLGGKV